MASIFDKIKTFDDYQRERQDFEAKRQLMNAQSGLLNAQVPKVQAEARDQDLTAAGNKFAMVGSILNGVKDQPSYDNAKQVLGSYGIVDPSQIPDKYDPSYVDTYKNSVLVGKQRIDQMLKLSEANKNNAGGDTGVLLNRFNTEPGLVNTYLGKVNANKGLITDNNGNLKIAPGYNNATASTETSKTEAAKTGENVSDLTKTYNLMQSNLPVVLQRFKEMSDAANDASSGFGVDQEGQGIAQKFAKSSLGKDKVSNANALLQQRAAQGILPELGPQLQGIRPNKFLESIASTASGLDLAAKPQDKLSLINGLQSTYINNLKSYAAQLRNAGAPSMSDEQIDSMVNNIIGGKVPTGGVNPIQNTYPYNPNAENSPEENIPNGGKVYPAEAVANKLDAYEQGKKNFNAKKAVQYKSKYGLE